MSDADLECRQLDMDADYLVLAYIIILKSK